LRLDGDGRRQHSFQEPRKFKHEFIRVDRAGTANAALAEREQPLRHVGAALSRLLGVNQFEAAGTVRPKDIERQPDIPEHNGELIVEVVSDAAHKRAQGLHPLGVPQLLLQLFLFGCVEAGGDHIVGLVTVAVATVSRQVISRSSPVSERHGHSRPMGIFSSRHCRKLF